MPRIWYVIVVSVLATLPVAGFADHQEQTVGRQERVAVAEDGRGFVLQPSGKKFIPWGHNYGRPDQLLEDFWTTDWEGVVADFREMKQLGTNVVRVHLQLGKFMESPENPNKDSLDQLEKLLRLAEEIGLYLDITGLGCYRPADVPKWYDGLSEADRWAVQARFWEAVAERASTSTAVFCYDLMNEPLAPAGKREPRQWYSGKLFGGFDFLQYIALDPGERKRADIPPAWIKTLTAAIRKHDQTTLITVGLLPHVPKWGHLSGFLPEKVAPELDFISVHFYPEKGKVDETIDSLKHFAVGKPVVIEETFPLSCSVEELEDFLKKSRGIACGWIGHYDGRSIEEFVKLREAKKITLGEAIYSQWLELFVRLKPEMVKD
jgi:hypothetical protein